MCKQRVALEMIEAQPDHGGMSDAAIRLHKKQCEDTEQMNKRITDIENKLDTVDRKVDNMQASITQLTKTVEASISAKQSITRLFSELLLNKWFWFWAIVITIMLGGGSLSELANIVHIGG